MSDTPKICPLCNQPLVTVRAYGTPIHYHGDVFEGLTPICPALKAQQSKQESA